MNTPNDNLHQTPEENNSLLDNLREPFQAWVTAGSRLGDVVSDFAGRFREDREQSDLTPGAHAIHTPVEEEDSTLGRLKAATQEARTGLSGASSTDDYRNVSATFASRAEDILRDLAASARRAAAETKDSTAAEEAKSALNTAVGSVRSTFDETVSQAKARRAAGATSGADNEDSLFDDLRERLEVLINRARAAADRDGATDVTPAPGAAPGATTTDGPVPHMIDGEVVDTDDRPSDKDV